MLYLFIMKKGRAIERLRSSWCDLASTSNAGNKGSINAHSRLYSEFYTRSAQNCLFPIGLPTWRAVPHYA